MGAQRGKDLLIKIKDESGAYLTVAGLRTKTLSFNSDTVDVTDSESIGRWRELLTGSGVKKCSLSGSGIFKDQASDKLLRQIFFASEVKDYQIILPDFGEFTGQFLIISLDFSGNHDGELTFDAAFESAGPLTFIELDD